MSVPGTFSGKAVVSALCKPAHLFWEAVPDGLDRAEVYLGLGREEYTTSERLGALLRLGLRARNRGGRLVLCNTSPLLREVFEIRRVAALPWLVVRTEGARRPVKARGRKTSTLRGPCRLVRQVNQVVG